MRWSVIVLVLLLAVPSMAVQMSLDSFDSPRPSYAFGRGEEFPGAKADVRWDREGAGSPGSLKINYDFSKGGAYAAWSGNYGVTGKETSVSFSAKGTGGAGVILRVTDSTEQIHQVALPAVGSEWTTRTVSLSPIESNAHWGGANDGVVHAPITAVSIGPTSGDGAKGWLMIDDLRAETSATGEEIREARMAFLRQNGRLAVSSSIPGLVFYPRDPKDVELRLADVPEGTGDMLVTLRRSDASGKAAPMSVDTVSLSRSNGYKVGVRLPADPGYWDVSYVVSGSSNGSRVLEGRFSYAVVAPPPSGASSAESRFGVNTHFNQGWPVEVGAIVKRVGIGWIRDGEANMDDKAYPVAQRNGLNYMPCFTSIVSPVLQKLRDGVAAGKTARDKWDFAPEAKVVADYVRKYGAKVDVYDLYNEPAASWSAILGGGWWGGDWLRVFSQWGSQVTAAIHEADPKASVLWEDADQLLYYKTFFDLRVAPKIDLISPHPYNLHRSIPDPEDQPIIGQLGELRRLTQEKGLRWKVVPGEVGFSSYAMPDSNPPPFYSPCSELQQAQWLVRMMVSQFSRGVTRIFWYDFKNDGIDPNNPEHNFGLFRFDLTPKPSGIAYANVIRQLNGAKWIGSYVIGGGGNALAANRSGQPLLIVWTRKGAKVESLPVRSGAKELTLTDIFGVTSKIPVKGGTAALPMGETPVYVTGLRMSDLDGLVQPL